MLCFNKNKYLQYLNFQTFLKSKVLYMIYCFVVNQESD